MVIDAMTQRLLVTDRGDAGRRLDLVVRRHLANLAGATRTRVQAWIDQGAVTVNGLRVCRASTRLTAGDRVAVTLPEAIAIRREPAAEELPLDILYEDEHLLAINKPAGIVAHPTYRHPDGTVLNALLWRARNWQGLDRPSVVGRLDKLTSGLMIAAKNAAAHAALQRALMSRRAEKEYVALVYGRVSPARGDIDLKLRRDPRDRRRVVASLSLGAASLTRFACLDSVAAPRVGLTLLRCQLVTGRMHQIRVHLAARGWPIVGDSKYGLPLWRDLEDAALLEAVSSLERQALHARRLALVHPMSGRRLELEAPYPPDLGRLLTTAGLVQLPR
jgi:23S rRNA pseudouridine1911/1915/1917 synthase